MLILKLKILLVLFVYLTGGFDGTVQDEQAGQSQAVFPHGEQETGP